MYIQKYVESGEAKAQAFGNGLLLVKAPKSFHRRVADLIKNVQMRKVKKDQRERLDYWLLLTGSDQVKGDDISSISKVVDSINEVDGKQNYKILEYLGSNTGLGREAKVKGHICSSKC